MKSEKIVLITGASSGIGAATAKKVVAAGHKAVITARSTDKLNALADQLGSDKVLAVTADVSKLDDIKNVVAKAKMLCCSLYQRTHAVMCGKLP
tara:strand:- start:2993 stop:3274 length:282 start_codon:yes stop_codon:yes gene_type:complete